ncbi:MAG TPA: hypothetical protein VIF62_05610 [Labilithrix sp.]
MSTKTLPLLVASLLVACGGAADPRERASTQSDVAEAPAALVIENPNALGIAAPTQHIFTSRSTTDSGRTMTASFVFVTPTSDSVAGIETTLYATVASARAGGTGKVPTLELDVDAATDAVRPEVLRHLADAAPFTRVVLATNDGFTWTFTDALPTKVSSQAPTDSLQFTYGNEEATHYVEQNPHVIRP